MLQPNDIFAGRYRVVRHIADGGMGSVYETEHIATEARVALKLLLPQMVQLEHARRRFELEAKVAARVNSEHIVKVLDAGVDPDTRAPYLAMELLAGETLAARVKGRGPLDKGTALDVMLQVSRGLDAAHRYRGSGGIHQPIVHRDLKPENLFLCPRTDGTFLVKILDFGIAKVLSEATEVSQELRGTPLYMAFEQAAGEAVSPQTDIWALGLVAYFALTGGRYWPAASKPTGTTEALFAEILTLPLPLPSERVRQEGLDLVLPRAFDTWLLTCLDRVPTRRYGSAALAVIALERALSSFAAPLGAPYGGHHPGSRVTTKYELPRPTSSSVNSMASLPAISSEPPRPPPPRAPHPSRLKLGGALVLASLTGSAIAWGLVRGRVFKVLTHVGVEAAPDPDNLGPPTPRTVDTIRLDQRGTLISQDVLLPIDESAAPSVAMGDSQRTPRVRVEALQPAAQPDSTPRQSSNGAPSVPPAAAASRRVTVPPQAPALRPVPPRPPAPAPEPIAATSMPAHTPSTKPAATAPKADEQAPTVATCEFFDPYAGRCTAVTAHPAESP